MPLQKFSAASARPLAGSDDVHIIRSMEDDFQKVIRRLVGVGGAKSLSGIDARMLSVTPGDDDTARLTRANGACLMSLCGGNEAVTGTTVLEDEATQGSSLARFLLRLSHWVLAEQRELADRHSGAARRRQQAAAWAERSSTSAWDQDAQNSIWGFLFPEGASCLDDPDRVVSALREKRTVVVDQLNPQPIADPITEMLFTSNILLTLPSDLAAMDDLPFSRALCDQIKTIAEEPQEYWFDHPIPLDIEADANAS